MQQKKKAFSTLLVFAVTLLMVPSAVNSSFSFSSQSATSHLPVATLVSSSQKSTFSFVSNFESFTLEGWQSIMGSSPSIVESPNYSGEPSLGSSASSGTQKDYADRGFVAGLDSLSFQVAIDPSEAASTGYFGLASDYGSNLTFVAVVGVKDGMIVAGNNIKNSVPIERIPTNTAYPRGWAYVTAYVSNNASTGWVMQVYVDRTDLIAANVSVPDARFYSGALIETMIDTVYYADIIVTSIEIPITIPGYNNMQGYGEGSGLLVSLLPAYYNLTARMTLNSWSVPQDNILSFQINAMNMTGTTSSTCVGFFQLGVDINTNGRIAPWYVPGVNCEAHYSWPNQNNGPGIGGIHSPLGTKLILSIIFRPADSAIEFKIVDLSTNQSFVKYISYSGEAFYSTYTQMEFQPCCNAFPITSYKLNGELYNMQITTVKDSLAQSLPAGYMIPFSLDAPPSWDFTYYQNSISGYFEMG
jgi:hypothetical protein